MRRAIESCVALGCSIVCLTASAAAPAADRPPRDDRDLRPKEVFIGVTPRPAEGYGPVIHYPLAYGSYCYDDSPVYDAAPYYDSCGPRRGSYSILRYPRDGYAGSCDTSFGVRIGSRHAYAASAPRARHR